MTFVKGCPCSNYVYMYRRPEEIGQYYMTRRKGNTHKYRYFISNKVRLGLTQVQCSPQRHIENLIKVILCLKYCSRNHFSINKPYRNITAYKKFC